MRPKRQVSQYVCSGMPVKRCDTSYKKDQALAPPSGRSSGPSFHEEASTLRAHLRLLRRKSTGTAPQSDAEFNLRIVKGSRHIHEKHHHGANAAFNGEVQ